ncbi:MAG: glycosyltransferase [Clostridiales bacterium]|nr:glycosyltransferase [Clostridiales bacterium]
MKILIFSASTGGGHKRAAAAVESKIKSISPQTEVRTVDAMKAIGRTYDKTICNGYHFMATKVPHFYGECYKITDRKTLMYKAVMRSNTIMAKKLLKTIADFNPDIVIICHPFITTMVSKLRELGKIDVKAISIITDYAAHRTYIVPHIDAYVLASPKMAAKLTDEYGVDKSLIHPLGIPIFDRFTEPFDKAEICRREGLDPNLPTVLLMAGSFGVTAVYDFYKELAERGRDMQFIIITGKNQHLYDTLEKLIKKTGTRNNTKLLYFVDNVEDYMHISDIIVTKPGGLTVTESLACGLPLAIYSAFPGQEYDNAEYLIDNGAAFMLDKKSGARDIIDLLNNPENLNRMKMRSRKLFIPNSAENIFNLAKEICAQDNQNTEDPQ